MKLPIIFSVAFWIALPSAVHAESVFFEIESWCFAKEIDFNARQPKECLSDPTEAKGTEKLFLWMNVNISEMGLKYLRRYSHLPIIHVWGRNGWIEGSEIDIGLKSSEWRSNRNSYESEYTMRGSYFNWRTWSEKAEYIYDGEHFVSVIDSEHEAAVLSKDRYRPCRPSLHIVRN